MPPQKLRAYQESGERKILDEYAAGARVVLAVAPTGSGKTTVFCDLVRQISAPSLILVHRRELAAQAANRLREFGLDFGTIMSGVAPKPYARVQIASVQTLARRKAPPAGFIVCDEAHLSTAKTWTDILDQYPRARILGVTATPWRLSGKPLVGAYDACVVVATPRELCAQGHLCPYVGFSYKAPDLSKVETVGGEYNEKQSAEAMREPSIVDNIVEQWLKHAAHLSTVVFAVTVEHSQALTEKFRAAGVRVEHLDGGTSVDTRAAILARVESGATQVLCNVGVAVEGLDIPRLKCCVLARPTKSLARAIQMMGRVRRPWEGQTARIHDHAFNIDLHGLPDADRDYTLNAKPAKPPALSTCELCLAKFDGPSCPACDHENEPKPRGERELVTVPDAEIFEFGSSSEPAPAPMNLPDVEIRWSQIGRQAEGALLGTWFEKEARFGPVKRYRLQGKKRTYTFSGSMVLDRKMAAVQLGQAIRVTFTGRQPLPGGRERKLFTVEVDDGA